MKAIKTTSALSNRGLFCSIMRHPDMRVLRLALRHLRDDMGRDWREEIHEAEIVVPHTFPERSWWQFITDRYAVATLQSEDPHLDYEDFIAVFADEQGCSENGALEVLDAESLANLAAYVESTSTYLEAVTSQLGPIQEDYCWMHTPGGWCCEQCATTTLAVQS